MAKLVPLAKGNYAKVSDEDYERVMFRDWCSTSPKNNKVVYAVTYINGKQIPMHRFILNPPPELDIDHINHDGLDNTRPNMRFSSGQQNIWNTRPHRDNPFGYKGVKKRGDKWEAVIGFKGKQVLLGRFERIEDAAIAYDIAAKHYYGEFAYLNFPDYVPEPEPIYHDKSYILLVGGGDTLVDEDLWDILYVHRWRKLGEGRQHIYRREHGKTIYMHREIMDALETDMFVDHINGIKNDNRTINLRVVTRQQNVWNSFGKSSNSSGYKGVGWSRRLQKWRARIQINGFHYEIGRYDTKEDAARGYDREAVKHFGEYAKLNFPKEWGRQ